MARVPTLNLVWQGRKSGYLKTAERACCFWARVQRSARNARGCGQGGRVLFAKLEAGRRSCGLKNRAALRS